MCLNLPVSLIYSVADGRLVGDDEPFRVFLALDCGHEFVPLRSVLVVEDQKVVCALCDVWTDRAVWHRCLYRLLRER